MPFPASAGQALFVSTGFCSLASFTVRITPNQLAAASAVRLLTAPVNFTVQIFHLLDNMTTFGSHAMPGTHKM